MVQSFGWRLKKKPETQIEAANKSIGTANARFCKNVAGWSAGRIPNTKATNKSGQAEAAARIFKVAMTLVLIICMPVNFSD
ncbi:hypothetical protein [Teredinibacter haidensis]|uniref:hypothetical protein n=1 Tax=Teredinibacter haidensis TaxID=2731755 RepID=UPI000948A9D8|nr:hypothetical protein [Teredinibacter haidensis]